MRTRGIRAAATAAMLLGFTLPAASSAHAQPPGMPMLNVQPSGTNKCATPQGNSTANGTRITLWTCTGSDLQNWIWRGDRIVHETSGKCLTPEGDRIYSNGAVLTLWPCTGAESQDFDQSVSDFFREIKTSHSNKCLTNYGGNLGNGTWVTLWTCAGGEPAEQNWHLEL
ncbi:RICIN domain-containing protein [Kitasatospora sp. NBC_00240]|uniref:RICIN domain-containing protein n=1 Tax=Kitasatospora sp. NBC_00240 TaxID=2903567 RepID=UPI00225B521C|nr:RICIN domain-containing protein [Kitasatospora sp. NBC_00240]MCX5214641.1 RICIN domain-containing protein [Kitasatospora sp. NBC_00240]